MTKTKTKSVRWYQKELRRLRNIIEAAQWVQPSYNGCKSCSGCGAMEHHGCYSECPMAAITGNFGLFEKNSTALRKFEDKDWKVGVRVIDVNQPWRPGTVHWVGKTRLRVKFYDTTATVTYDRAHTQFLQTPVWY